MLECYFDDSGTHDSSKVAVWGGLFGPPSAFDKLTLSWSELLKSPLPGKPSLSKMSLSNLAGSKGEFVNYNSGERDLLRREFRNLIVEAGLDCIAYIVIVDDWLEASTENDRLYLGDAKNFAFQGILEAVAALAKMTGQDISCHLDQGAQNTASKIIQGVWQEMRPDAYAKTHFTYSAVERLLGLQAADVIAYEAYHYGLHLIDPVRYPENPHFIDLRNRTNVLFLSLHEPEMREHLSKWRHFMISNGLMIDVSC